MGAAVKIAEGDGLFTGATSMGLQKAIHELYDEKQRLDGVISSLEEYLGRKRPTVVPKRKRGRKSMSPAEREEVSVRMRSYWAARRSGAAS